MRSIYLYLYIFVYLATTCNLPFVQPFSKYRSLAIQKTMVVRLSYATNFVQGLGGKVSVLSTLLIVSSLFMQGYLLICTQKKSKYKH